jgi:hypothetical protein
MLEVAAPSTLDTNVWFWLKADLKPPEIDFRFTPNTRHSEAHAGLPVLTRLGHFGVFQPR